VILAFTLPRMNIRVEMRDMMCSVMLPVGALALLVAIIAGITAANWSALLAGWRRTG
jgi:hypothetical protein